MKKNRIPYRKTVTEGEKLNSFKVRRYEVGKYDTITYTKLPGRYSKLTSMLSLSWASYLRVFALGSSHAPNRPTSLKPVRSEQGAMNTVSRYNEVQYATYGYTRGTF